jgi:hypothetical protein
MIDVTVSSDEQSRVRRYLSEVGSSGNALIGVPLKDRSSKHTISLIDKGSFLIGVPSNFRVFKDIICLINDEGISLMPVLLKSRITKDFTGTVISGRLSSFEQPLIFNLRSLVRNWIDEGTSLIAVPISSNTSISPEISGNLVIFEQPYRLRCCNLPVTDCGTSLIEVCSNHNHTIFCEIVGHVVISRHRPIERELRTFESSIGKLLRL